MKGYLKFTIVFLFVSSVVISFLLFKQNGDINALHLYIKSFGFLAPIAFVFLYMLGTVSLLPAACMSFLGGYIFGFTQGLILNMIGSACGVTFAFLIGRYLAKDMVRKRLGSKSTSFLTSVEKLGWKFVALFRLTPLLPFDILNFAFGITNIKVFQYLWSSMLFMLPGMITYTCFGKMGLELLVGQPRFLAIKLLIVSVILSVVLFLAYKVLFILRQRLITEDMQEAYNEIYRAK